MSFTALDNAFYVRQVQLSLFDDFHTPLSKGLLLEPGNLWGHASVQSIFLVISLLLPLVVYHWYLVTYCLNVAKFDVMMKDFIIKYTSLL